jgi:hypothetical protein
MLSILNALTPLNNTLMAVQTTSLWCVGKTNSSPSRAGTSSVAIFFAPAVRMLPPLVQMVKLAGSRPCHQLKKVGLLCRQQCSLATSQQYGNAIVTASIFCCSASLPSIKPAFRAGQDLL